MPVDRAARAGRGASRSLAAGRGRLLPLGWGRDNPAFRHFFARLFLPEGTEEQISWFGDLQRHSAAPEAAARLFEEFSRIDVTEAAPGCARRHSCSTRARTPLFRSTPGGTSRA